MKKESILNEWKELSYKELCSIVGDEYDSAFEVETDSLLEDHGYEYVSLLCKESAYKYLYDESITEEYLWDIVWYLVKKKNTEDYFICNLFMDGFKTYDGKRLEDI